MSGTALRPLAAALAFALLLAAGSAAAQTSIGVFGGYVGSSGIDNAAADQSADVDSGGMLLLSVGRDLDGRRELQLQFAQQSTSVAPGVGAAPFDLTVRYLHVGGTAFIDQAIGPGPYAVGGLGATFFDPGASGYGSEVKPSINVGFGWLWPLTEAVALRAEVRGFFTFVNSSGGFLCSGGCVAVLKSDVFSQYGALLGVTARF